MPRARLSAYKSSITNRGPQSGGSVGGNDKAGLVNLWQYSGIVQSVVKRRLPGDCCLKLEFSYPGPSVGPGPSGPSVAPRPIIQNGGQVVF
jgi:hypothetical protein